MSPLATLFAGLAVVAPAAGPLTFDDALGLSARAPQVVGAERAVAAKREAARHVSGQPYNPSLMVQPGYRVLMPEAREPELIVELVQSWNLSGLRKSRAGALAAEEQTFAVEARATALGQRLLAARAWLDAWSAEAVLVEARRQEAVASDLLKLVERTAALGSATKADVAEARSFLAEARLVAISSEGEVFERDMDLARETGGHTPRPTAGALPAPRLPEASEWPGFVDRAAAMPEVQVRAMRARAMRAREAEERAARGWLGQFGVNLQRDAPGGLVISGVARITAPLFDRGERERSQMLADAERLDGEHQAARVSAAAELVTAFHEVAHTGEIADALGSQLVPSTGEAATLLERIYQLGEVTLFEVLAARRAAMAAAGRLARARGAHAWARVKVWLLLASLPTAGGRP